jgi:hypothetical protein
VIPAASVTSRLTGTDSVSPGAPLRSCGIEIRGSAPVAAGGVMPAGSAGMFGTATWPMARRTLVVSLDWIVPFKLMSTINTGSAIG